MTAARPTVWRAFCQEWEWEGARHSTALTAVHWVLQRVNPKITHYSVGSRSRTMYCTDSGVQVLYSYGETGNCSQTEFTNLKCLTRRMKTDICWFYLSWTYYGFPLCLSDIHCCNGACSCKPHGKAKAWAFYYKCLVSDRFLNSQLCVMSKREDNLNMVISGSQKPHPTTDQGFCL